VCGVWVWVCGGCSTPSALLVCDPPSVEEEAAILKYYERQLLALCASFGFPHKVRGGQGLGVGRRPHTTTLMRVVTVHGCRGRAPVYERRQRKAHPRAPSFGLPARKRPD
jgi:hypothetical protein